MLKKIIYYLLLLFLFLLPWQTRLVFEPRYLNGGFWEYGSSSWYATEVLLWMIIILFALDLFRKKELWQRVKNGQGSKRNLIIALLVISYLLLGIAHSTSPVVSFNFVFRLIGAACLLVILSGAKNPLAYKSFQSGDPSVAPLPQDDSNTLLVALWASGVVQGLLALWQFITQKVQHFPLSGIAPHLPQDLGAFVIEVGDERWLRAYGAFGSPNILGGSLAIVFLLGLILYLKTPSSWTRIGLMIGNLVVTAGLVVSFSRAAWVAAGVGSLCVIASLARARRGDPLAGVPGVFGDCFVGRSSLLAMTVRQLAFSLAVILIFFLALKPLFLTRLSAAGRLEAQSMETRVEQYQDFKKIFRQHPIIGVGPGAYTLALYKNNPTLPAWRYQPIHNIYLLILTELGVVGLAIISIFPYFIISFVWRHNRLFFPILISILILGLFDHWLWSMYTGLMVVSSVIGLGMVRRVDKTA